MYRFGLFLFLLLPPSALAQYNPYAPPAQLQDFSYYLRRAQREQAVARAGPAAREMVEKEGDEATAALLASSQPVARKLAEWHASGGLGKIPKPRDLLRAIAKRGDDVALWAMQHQAELADVDNLTAFCADPMLYVLNLKPLAEDGAEIRARRLAAQLPTTPPVPPGIPIAPMPTPPATQFSVDNRVLGAVGGGLILVLIVVAWKRRNGGGGMAV